MILLTVDEIIGLHSKLIAKTGGSDGLRDLGLLESAVYSAQPVLERKSCIPQPQRKQHALCTHLFPTTHLWTGISASVYS